MIIFLFFIIVFIISFFFFIWELSRFNVYLHHLAETYTFDEIQEKIKYEKDFLENGNLKGVILENCLYTIDYWEEVLRIKEEMQKDSYEDIIY